MPDISYISPAGYLVEFRAPSYPYREGSGLPIVTPAPTVPSFQVSTIDIHPIGSEFDGKRGTMDLFVTLGAAGTARALAFFTDARTPTNYLGIAIDASNRPFIILKNAAGGTVAQTSSNSPALSSGTTLFVRLGFDSATPLVGARHAFFDVPDTIVKTWVVSPEAPWAPLDPSWLFAGIGGFAGLSDFNGTFHRLSISTQAAQPPYSEEDESLALVAALTCGSSYAASLKLKLGPTAALSGTGALTASAKLSAALTGSLSGAGTFTSSAKLSASAAASLSGAATVTADATVTPP